MAVQYASDTARYLGQCDRLRSQSAANESAWHVMVNNATVIDRDEFTSAVNGDDLHDVLDADGYEGTNNADQIATALDELEREAGSCPLYHRSVWGASTAYYYQIGGFEFIFIVQ